MFPTRHEDDPTNALNIFPKIIENAANDPKLYLRWFQNDRKMILKCHYIDSNTSLKWSQNHPKMLQINL